MSAKGWYNFTLRWCMISECTIRAKTGWALTLFLSILPTVWGVFYHVCSNSTVPFCSLWDIQLPWDSQQPPLFLLKTSTDHVGVSGLLPALCQADAILQTPLVCNKKYSYCKHFPVLRQPQNERKVGGFWWRCVLKECLVPWIIAST